MHNKPTIHVRTIHTRIKKHIYYVRDIILCTTTICIQYKIYTDTYVDLINTWLPNITFLASLLLLLLVLPLLLLLGVVVLLPVCRSLVVHRNSISSPTTCEKAIRGCC